MRSAFLSGLVLLLADLAQCQVLPGDIGITGFSTTSFGIASPPPAVTIYNAGSFQGTGAATSQAILHDPSVLTDFIVGGFGFVGRASITGPGTVTYTLITNGIGTASQMSWDNFGNLIIADAGIDQVSLVTTSGVVFPLSSGAQPWGTNVNAGAYERATGDVIVGGSGALYRLPNGLSTGVLIVSGLGGFVSGVTFDPCTGDIFATILAVNRLVRVDILGTVTDVIPPGSVVSPNSLDLDENGNFIIGGANGQVFRSPPGGPATLIATATGVGSSASGVAYVSGHSCAFSVACPAPFGMPTLSSGPYAAGALLTTTSINHNSGAIGVAIFGLSAVIPPLPLGPLLGATGCFLNVIPDFLDFGITDGSGTLVHSLPTNSAFAYQRVFVQHAVLEFGSFVNSSFSTGLSLQF